MWLYAVFALLGAFFLGLFIGGWLASKPDLDGHLVITENDGKTLMSFDFDNGDHIVALRNKQVVSFKVVGPEILRSSQFPTPTMDEIGSSPKKHGL